MTYWDHNTISVARVTPETCRSTHGGAGYAPGSYVITGWLGRRLGVICGWCGGWCPYNKGMGL